MKTNTTKDKDKKHRDNGKTKSTYQKPGLHKYGSVVSLTAGLGGSVADTSGPGTRPA